MFSLPSIICYSLGAIIGVKANEFQSVHVCGAWYSLQVTKYQFLSYLFYNWCSMNLLALLQLFWNFNLF